jgi:hypothetical protein
MDKFQQLRGRLAAAIRSEDRRLAKELKAELDAMLKRETAVRPPEERT